MTAIDTLNTALFGNPPTPDFKPDRSGVLQAFTEIYNQIAALTVGVVTYDTAAHLPVSPTPALGSQARVYADATSTNNTYWIYKSGGWVIDTDLINSLATVVAPLVTAAAASATAAAASATSATASAAAAAASAASVHSSDLIVGDEAPGANVGAIGNFYNDLVNLIQYGPKTASGWGQGRPIKLNALSPWTVWDFRYSAILPSGMVLARSQTSTDAIYSDAPGRTYNAVAANAPHLRSDLGLGVFPQSRNYLLNSAVPVTQTVTLAAGKYILWGNGTGTLTSAAGTAVGSGFGALSLPGRAYQVITITTGGTVSITLSGACNYFQLESAPGALSNPSPTPLIVTTTTALTRDGDLFTASGAILSLFQAAAATIIFETTNCYEQPTTNSAFFRTNSNGSFYRTSDTAVTYWDGAGYAIGVSLGTAAYSGGRVRSAISWGAGSLNVSYGAGAHTPITSTTVWNGGNAVSSVALLCDNQSNTGVADAMNGWLVRLEYQQGVNIALYPLYQTYSSLLLPTAAIIDNFSAERSMRNFKGAIKQNLAGVRDVNIVFAGTSHTAAVAGASGADVRSTSYPSRVGDLLNAAGFIASTDNWFGNGGVTPTTGVSAYNAKLSLSAGWSLWGVTLGGDCLKTTTNGATATDTPAKSSDTYKLFYSTGPSYGSFTLSVDGSVVSTINCNVGSALALATLTVNPTAGAHVYKVTSTSTSPLVLRGAIASLSTEPRINIINGGRPLFTAVQLSTDTGPEVSYWDVIRLLKPDVTFVECVTNDVVLGTSFTNYDVAVNFIITNAKLYGDVVVLSDPVTSEATVSVALQTKYTAHEIAAAYAADCPVIDLHNYEVSTGAYDAWSADGMYGDTTHLSYLFGHPMTAALAFGCLVSPKL